MGVKKAVRANLDQIEPKREQAPVGEARVERRAHWQENGAQGEFCSWTCFVTPNGKAAAHLGVRPRRAGAPTQAGRRCPSWTGAALCRRRCRARVTKPAERKHESSSHVLAKGGETGGGIVGSRWEERDGASSPRSPPASTRAPDPRAPAAAAQKKHAIRRARKG